MFVVQITCPRNHLFPLSNGGNEREIDGASDCIAVSGQRLRADDWLSLDGKSGEVSLGRRASVPKQPQAERAEIGRCRAALAAPAEHALVAVLETSQGAT